MKATSHFARFSFRVTLDEQTRVQSFSDSAFVKFIDVSFYAHAEGISERVADLSYSSVGVAVLKNGKPGTATRHLYVIREEDLPEGVQAFAEDEVYRYLATFAPAVSA